MENQKQSDTIQIGNTTFYVTATFSGTVQLQHLIKRLIQKEIEQEKITQQMAEKSLETWYNHRVQSSLFAVGKEQKC